MATIKKISNINDDLDIKLFLYLTKRNLFISIIFLSIAIVIAFLYLRYTPPVFETKAILQVNIDNQAQTIWGQENIFENDLTREIELLRSPIFIKKALSKLPLDVSYFSKGNFLNFELYKSTPYIIFAKVKNSNIYNTPVFIDFDDNKNFTLSYTLHQNKIEKSFPLSDTAHLADLDLFVNITQPAAIKHNQGFLSSNSYFFIINNQETLIKQIIANLKINILNEAAKTIQIKYADKNSNKTCDIVNTIAEEFIYYDIEKKAESANKVLAYIDSQLDYFYDQLYNAENQLDNYKRNYNIDSGHIQLLPTLHSRYNDMGNQLAILEMEESRLIDLEKSIKDNPNIDIYSLIAIVAGSEFKGVISNILSSLQDLLIQREKMLYQVTDQSNQIKTIDYQIEIQKKLLTESISTLRSNIQNRKKDLQKKINGMEGSIFGNNKTKINTIELSRLQRVYNINEKFYWQLIDKKAEFSISKAGYVSQITLLEKAAIPYLPLYPIPKKIYITAILIALFLSIFLITIKYLFYNEIRNIEDITRHTKAPILGIIPKYTKPIPNSQIIVDQYPKSIIAEALRIIRSNLQFIDGQAGSKIISITSTISGEGKTFAAINLAGIIAFTDKKVIVLDVDMRKPKIHKGFNISNTNGVSTILAGKTSIEECIQNSQIPNLDIITAGPVPPNPSELILNERMDYLLQKLKKQYDFIIIDNPPVGVVSDGIKNIMLADYPIYIFKAHYSKRQFIQNLNHLIVDNRISKLSIILNNVSEILRSYNSQSYKFGYSYGYGYYDEDTEKEKKNSFFHRLLKIKFINKLISF